MNMLLMIATGSGLAGIVVLFEFARRVDPRSGRLLARKR